MGSADARNRSPTSVDDYLPATWKHESLRQDEREALARTMICTADVRVFSALALLVNRLIEARSPIPPATERSAG